MIGTPVRSSSTAATPQTSVTSTHNHSNDAAATSTISIPTTSGDAVDCLTGPQLPYRNHTRRGWQTQPAPFKGSDDVGEGG